MAHVSVRTIWDGKSSSPLPLSALTLNRRYTLIVLGALVLLFALTRMFVFKIPESPRYLLSVGRDADAIAALGFIARRNGKQLSLTLADLEAVDHQFRIATASAGGKSHLSAMERVKTSVAEYSGGHIAALFATKKMGFHLITLWIIWGMIGIAYVTPNLSSTEV